MFHIASELLTPPSAALAELQRGFVRRLALVLAWPPTSGAWLIESSLRQSASRVRICAVLCEPDTGFIVESFSRDYDLPETGGTALVAALAAGAVAQKFALAA